MPRPQNIPRNSLKACLQLITNHICWKKKERMVQFTFLPNHLLADCIVSLLHCLLEAPIAPSSLLREHRSITLLVWIIILRQGTDILGI